MPKEKTRPARTTVLNNADESEPGTFKDRLLMERDPHLVVESTMLSGYAMQTDICFIYIRGEYTYTRAKMLEQRDPGGLRQGLRRQEHPGQRLGLRAGRAAPRRRRLHLRRGDRVDELARGRPRLSAFQAAVPGAVSGVWGMPTTINNVETLACVPFIVERGAEWFAGMGHRREEQRPEALLPERPRQAAGQLRSSRWAFR